MPDFPPGGRGLSAGVVLHSDLRSATEQEAGSNLIYISLPELLCFSQIHSVFILLVPHYCSITQMAHLQIDSFFEGSYSLKRSHRKEESRITS